MLAEAIARHLETEGHGTFGTDLYVSVQPDRPNDCVTLVDENATVPPEAQAYRVDHTGLQVVARAVNYEDARTKIWAIHRELVAYSGTLDGTVITFIQIEQPPGSIGVDENQRAEWSSHYVIRFQSTGDAHRTDI